MYKNVKSNPFRLCYPGSHVAIQEARNASLDPMFF